VLLLTELIKDWPCRVVGGEFRVKITGVTENSKSVREGNIFVARSGKTNDGLMYVDEAIKNGATAIIIDKPLFKPVPLHIPVVTVPDCRKFLSYASAILAGHPSERLTIIAITGTNGKTTVSYFIGQLLQRLGVKTAVIGTTGVFIDDVKIAFEMPEMTTLPAPYLHSLLKRCEEEEVTHVILEASSLGLSSFRLEHCVIDVGVILNVGSDHYDEHGGKKEYIEAKKNLVRLAKQLVVNHDDAECVKMMESSSKSCTYFGTTNGSDVCLHLHNHKLLVKTKTEEGELKLLVLGEFNRNNAIAAISALLSLGYSLKELLPLIPLLTLPEGRMQRIEHGGITVVIDYAHSPDALEAVLFSLNKVCQRRLLTVFGCGGNRDKGKRSVMGELAVLYSSCVVVTSDNPRNEDPLTIIQEVTEGFGEYCTAVIVEPNRRQAITNAIEYASAGDIVLIAGKGHEKTQHTAEGILPFSDLEEAKKALMKKFIV